MLKTTELRQILRLSTNRKSHKDYWILHQWQPMMGFISSFQHQLTMPFACH